MRKKLILLSVSTILMMGIPANAAMYMVSEMGVAEQVEEHQPTIAVEDNNTVSITGANGLTLEIVSLTGRAVARYKIDSPAQRIELNLPKGCYILKVGKVVRKVTLR